MKLSDAHLEAIAAAAHERGVVMMVGGPDTGKTTFAKAVLAAGAEAGTSAAFVDGDITVPSVGPPACAGLKWVGGLNDLDHHVEADSLRFVGSTLADDLVLQQVTSTAALVSEARSRAELVVIDTTGAVSGVIGQTLKYHKTELCRPELIIGIQRGQELEPVLGMLQRFFDARVVTLPVPQGVIPASPDELDASRAKLFAEAFADPLETWRVRPTVFAPTLPAGLDMARLDRMLVGIQDAEGKCLGLGVLRVDETDTVRVMTNSGENMRGLRLGSMRLDLESFHTERVRLREVMFGF